jgi:hypothetical protein
MQMIIREHALNIIWVVLDTKTQSNYEVLATVAQDAIIQQSEGRREKHKEGLYQENKYLVSKFWSVCLNGGSSLGLLTLLCARFLNC